MIASVIQYCSDRLKIIFRDITIKGLFDIVTREENNKEVSFPAGYGQDGEYTDRADFDNHKGLIYFRKTGDMRSEPIEDDWNDTMERRTYPMRLILYIPKDYYNTDDVFIEDKLYENIRGAITARAVAALTESTGLQSLEITPNGFVHNARDVWEGEYKNIPFDIPFDKAFIAVNFEVVAEGALECFENWACGDQEELITFCPIVLNSDGTILVSGAGRSGEITLRDSDIYDTEGNLLHSVPATTDQVIADSIVSNSDDSYTAHVLAEGSLELPDSHIYDSDGNLLYNVPATEDQVIADSNVRNSNSSYSVDLPAQTDLVLPDSHVRDSAGNLLHTVPATSDQAISDTTVKNSANTTIGTGHAESIIILADKSLKNSAGTTIGSIVQGVDKTAPDGTLKNTLGDTIGLAPSGAITTLPNKSIYNSIGEYLGPVYAGRDVVDGDSVVQNSDLSYNVNLPGASLLALSDISVTNYDGSTTSHPAAINVVSTQLARTYAFPHPTGQTTIYRTGDDADIQQTIFNALPTGYIIPLASFFVLRGNNIFGNTNRFTDHLGGQTYAASYLIDHYTGLGWYTLSFTGDWNTAIDGGLSFSLTVVGDTYTDWFIPNTDQLLSIAKREAGITPVFNYAPFNSAVNPWTSTTHAVSATQAIRFSNAGVGTNAAKTGSNAYFVCRKHF
jgi:hypothetical protein